MEYNSYIDHTLLAPDATKAQIEKIVQEAKDNHFKSVCINPSWIPLCSKELKGTGVDVTTVIGFPLGATLMASKISEAKEAIFEGADELDMVINVGRLKDHDDNYVEREIRELKNVCGKKTLKVIIETCLLTDEEKVRACQLAKKAGADFVKTSTGFSKGGATVHDVELMRKTVGPEMGVKASGGVRTREEMLAMIKAGATRIGTSHGVDLMKKDK
jgi:deoxyribose-phosphate aldolase